MYFDWDEGNINHIIEEHHVQPEETMEVLFNQPVHVTKEMKKGELRYRVVGCTDNDRILTVVFTIRGSKIHVVTAFDSGRKDIRKYQGRKGKNV